MVADKGNFCRNSKIEVKGTANERLEKLKWRIRWLSNELRQYPCANCPSFQHITYTD